MFGRCSWEMPFDVKFVGTPLALAVHLFKGQSLIALLLDSKADVSQSARVEVYTDLETHSSVFVSGCLLMQCLEVF